MTTSRDTLHERERRLTVAISGSSGLIGSALASALRAGGHTVRPLVRRAARGDDEIPFDPARGEIDRARLATVDAVVNLAGEPLDQRWSDDVKRAIRESRVTTTALLARSLAELAPRPLAFLSGSAIGIYGDRGDEILDESSGTGSDFLAAVCRDWESATAPAADAGIRTVHLRTGIVLSRSGGALARLLTPFRLGVGGKLGSGRQWMSWIALRDVVGAVQALLANDDVRGPVNLVAPNPVRNEELTRALAHEIHRPSAFPVPRFAMRLLLGEMADTAVLASQRVVPRRLMESRYAFALPTIEQALASILSS